MSTGDRTTVLVAAAGAPWESTALRTMTGAGLVVLKRCVDLADLLASAGSGQADVAVVSADLPGLDASAVTHLLRHDVRAVAVGAEGIRGLARIGVVEVLPDDGGRHPPRRRTTGRHRGPGARSRARTRPARPRAGRRDRARPGRRRVGTGRSPGPHHRGGLRRRGAGPAPATRRARRPRPLGWVGRPAPRRARRGVRAAGRRPAGQRRASSTGAGSRPPGAWSATGSRC